MNREDALNSIEDNVSNINLVKHMLATEAIMRALARRLGQDEAEWGLTGLLHDIDVDLTGDDPSSHSRLGADLAREMGATQAMAHAILCHNEAHGVPRLSLLDKALYCVDPLTGLIIAATLIRQEKKLATLDAGSVLKRFNEKRFAAGANRDQIASCHEVGVKLEDMVSLGLRAMQEIAPSLGL